MAGVSMAGEKRTKPEIAALGILLSAGVAALGILAGAFLTASFLGGLHGTRGLGIVLACVWCVYLLGITLVGSIVTANLFRTAPKWSITSGGTIVYIVLGLYLLLCVDEAIVTGAALLGFSVAAWLVASRGVKAIREVEAEGGPSARGGHAP